MKKEVEVTAEFLENNKDFCKQAGLKKGDKFSYESTNSDDPADDTKGGCPEGYEKNAAGECVPKPLDPSNPVNPGTGG